MAGSGLRLSEPDRAERLPNRLPSMNSFDAAVYFVLIVAIVTGYNSGLLRSMADHKRRWSAPRGLRQANEFAAKAHCVTA